MEGDGSGMNVFDFMGGVLAWFMLTIAFMVMWCNGLSLAHIDGDFMMSWTVFIAPLAAGWLVAKLWMLE
jgi:hypothetical protein